MLPIEIILKNNCTEIAINNDLKMRLTALRSYIKFSHYKESLKYLKAGAHHIWYVIPYKMTETQKKALLSQLYIANNLDMKHEIKKQTEKTNRETERKALKNKIPNTITGFKGNLLTNFIFLDGKTKHNSVRVYDAD